MQHSPSSFGIRNVEVWVAVLASGAGLTATYWDSSWHTTLGRDSALIPPHLLLYVSIAMMGVVLAVWALRVLRRTRSVPAVFRARGFLLAIAAVAATAAAAPADAFWHDEFGRDAVLWSPPHLLSVVATTVFLAALLIALDDTNGRALRVAVSASLLGASQIVVLEYDTDVPQFAEALYLPLLLVTSLGAAWVIVSTTGIRFAVSGAVVGYVVFRLLVLVGLGAPGWIPPDIPLGLLGLLLLDLPRISRRRRWLLAIVAVAGLQVIASLTGLSSVNLVSAVQSALVIAGLSVFALLVMLIRFPAARSVLLLLLVAGATVSGPSPVFAHDPGQGSSLGAATMTVFGDGSGRIEVRVTGVDTTTDVDLQPQGVTARRAGEAVLGPLSEADGGVRFDGSIQLPSPGLWFVYAEFTVAEQALEVWLPVQRNLNGAVTEQRLLYEPVGIGERPVIEYVAGALLYAVAAALIGWVVIATRRRGQILAP